MVRLILLVEVGVYVCVHAASFVNHIMALGIAAAEICCRSALSAEPAESRAPGVILESSSL